MSFASPCIKMAIHPTQLFDALMQLFKQQLYNSSGQLSDVGANTVPSGRTNVFAGVLTIQALCDAVKSVDEDSLATNLLVLQEARYLLQGCVEEGADLGNYVLQRATSYVSTDNSDSVEFQLQNGLKASLAKHASADVALKQLSSNWRDVPTQHLFEYGTTPSDAKSTALRMFSKLSLMQLRLVHDSLQIVFRDEMAAVCAPAPAAATAAAVVGNVFNTTDAAPKRPTKPMHSKRGSHVGSFNLSAHMIAQAAMNKSVQ